MTAHPGDHILTGKHTVVSPGVLLCHLYMKKEQLRYAALTKASEGNARCSEQCIAKPKTKEPKPSSTVIKRTGAKHRKAKQRRI